MDYATGILEIFCPIFAKRMTEREEIKITIEGKGTKYVIKGAVSRYFLLFSTVSFFYKL